MDLWPALADGVIRMLAQGPRGEDVRAPGSSLAFSGAEVADLNMAFAWGDLTALVSLTTRSEDCVVVTSTEGNALVAEHAEGLGLVSVPDPLPVWLGEIRPDRLPPAVHSVGRVGPGGMSQVRAVLADAFGLDVEPLTLAFPDATADDLDVYLATRDSAPIAAAMAIRAGDFVGLWSGGTIVSAQGQGVFTDLLAQILIDQHGRGARLFSGITEAVASGKAVERVGGVKHCDAHVWVRGSAAGELLQA